MNIIDEVGTGQAEILQAGSMPHEGGPGLSGLIGDGWADDDNPFYEDEWEARRLMQEAVEEAAAYGVVLRVQCDEDGRQYFDQGPEDQGDADLGGGEPVRDWGSSYSRGETRLPYEESEILGYGADSGLPGTAPPLLLGGVKRQERENIRKGKGFVGVHWLQGTVEFGKLNEVRGCLKGFFGGEWEELRYGLFTFQRVAKLQPSGLLVAYDETPERNTAMHAGRIMVQLQGDIFDGLQVKDLMTLLGTLKDRFDFKCTRLDVYYDDMSRSLTPHELVQKIKPGFGPLNVTGFRKMTPRAEFGLCGEYLRDEVTFGSRGENGSGKYLRVYDKKIESKGELVKNIAIRWELELSKGRAQAAWSEVVAVLGDLGKFASVLGGLVGGCVGFVDRRGNGKESHVTRFDLLDFWQEMVGMLGRVEVKLAQRAKTFEKAKEYLVRQVSSTLAMMKAGLPPAVYADFLDALQDTGEIRMTKRQELLAKEQRELCPI